MTKLLLRFSLSLVAAAPLYCAAPTITAVVNAASYSTRLAPGTWAAIFGTSLSASTATAPSVPLGTSLVGVTVSIGKIAAPLNYVSATQINVVIPFEIAIPASGPDVGVSVPVVVTTAAGASAAFNITLWQDAPALFTKDGSGTGAALAFDANFKPVTAIGNTPIVLYATGLGATSPAGSSSSGGVSAPPFNTITDPLAVTVGGAAATVGFAGLAPGFPGIYQLNVTPNSQANPFVNLIQNTCTPAAAGLFSCVGGQSAVISQSVTIGAGSNVTNVKGSIDGIYPATGANIAAEGANPTGPGSSLGISVAFLGANFTLDFDVVPNAKPFSITAVTGAGYASISVDPAHGTWQGTLPAPPATPRSGDFSALLPTQVMDFFSCDAQGRCGSLPGNFLPASRLDPVLLNALQTVPLPTTASGINGTASVSGTLTGGHFHWDSSVSFGGFSTIVWNGPPPSIRSTTFTLTVDGLTVASTTGMYRAY